MPLRIATRIEEVFVSLIIEQTSFAPSVLNANSFVAFAASIAYPFP